MTSKQKDKQVWKEFAKKHPAMVITISYIVLNLVSFLSNFFYFNKYGIDYSQFAEINDLLFGFLKIAQNIWLQIVLIFGVLGYLLVFKKDVVIAQIKNNNKNWMYIVVILISAIGISMGLIRSYSGPREVLVSYIRDKSIDSLYFLGTTEKYHFFLTKESDSTISDIKPRVISNTVIKSMTFLDFKLEEDVYLILNPSRPKH